MTLTPANRKRRGFVTIYVVFTSLVLIPVVGLAIDFSVLYNVKARLQTAVDAGAIAAGYTLQRSTNINDPAITNTAQVFFNANYPSHYWGSTQANYSATTGVDANSVRSIQVQASEYVPLLFLRVLGLSNSTVAAAATVKVRFVTMMIVVDRSGSVLVGHNDTTIENALTQFVATASSSVFVDGRDEIGMVSFGGTYHLDLPPTVSFRSGTPNMTSAITTLGTEFGNNSTNTGEGLHQAYTQLQTLNQIGSLNVILLLTDGRPSSFTASYSTYSPSSTCTTMDTKTGFVTAYVGVWPPPTVDGTSGIYSFGLFQQNPATLLPLDPSLGDANHWVANSANCKMLDATSTKGTDVYLDFPNFPNTDAYGNSTTTGVYPLANTALNNPQNVRYAAFNAADNQATAIRSDTTLRPVLFVIGLNEPTGEPLDADWLARVANDPGYKDQFGNSVFQSGQTSGKYYNVNGAGLSAAFNDIASQILRLSQ